MRGQPRGTGDHFILPIDENDFCIPVDYAAEGIVAQKFGGETNATTGFTSVGLDGTGANKFESQVATVDTGEFAIEADANDTPTVDARFWKDIQTDMSISNDDIVRLECKIRHKGSGGNWRWGLGANNNSTGGSTAQTILTAETTFESKAFYWVHDADYRYFVCSEFSATDNGGIFFDNFKVQKVTFT